MLQKFQNMLLSGLESILKFLAHTLETLQSGVIGTKSTDVEEAFQEVCSLEFVIEEINNQISELEKYRDQVSKKLDVAHIKYTNLKLKD